jgi:hypothetical protein
VVANSIAGASLASNTITLPAGTYETDISVPAYVAGYTRAFLRVSGGGALVLNGDNGYGASNVTNTLRIRGRFTRAATTTLEVAQYCSTSNASLGLGVAANLAGFNEIYTEAMFWKVD